MEDIAVKIKVSGARPDYLRPWNLRRFQTSGSGTILGPNRVLTCAHVVADARFVEVKRQNEARSCEARVLHVAHDIDLALLAVDDKTFFGELPKIQFGKVPRADEEVRVCGYSSEADKATVTKGVVSRLDQVFSMHALRYLRAGQIDAAVNEGSSGGPVVGDGLNIVGLVMQSCPDAENIGYFIPVDLIKRFLKDVEDGSYDGCPSLGLEVQPMLSKSLRSKYGMPEGESGVLVDCVLPIGSANRRIQPSDILLSINNMVIANDGTVKAPSGGRMWFEHVAELCQLGDEIKLRLRRGNQEAMVDIKLIVALKDGGSVVPMLHDKQPPYFVFAGIVFRPLTQNLIKALGTDTPPAWAKMMLQWRTEKQEEFVVALNVLAAPVNEGYRDVNRWVVIKVDGRTFQNFSEFVGLVKSAKGTFVTFSDKRNYQLVVDRELALRSHEKILSDYGVSSGSAETTPVTEDTSPKK